MKVQIIEQEQGYMNPRPWSRKTAAIQLCDNIQSRHN